MKLELTPEKLQTLVLIAIPVMTIVLNLVFGTNG
jgi:hypothetical protein